MSLAKTIGQNIKLAKPANSSYNKKKHEEKLENK